MPPYPSFRINLFGIVVGFIIFASYVLLFRIYPHHNNGNLPFSLQEIRWTLNKLNNDECQHILNENKIPIKNGRYNYNADALPSVVKARWDRLRCSIEPNNKLELLVDEHSHIEITTPGPLISSDNLNQIKNQKELLGPSTANIKEIVSVSIDNNNPKVVLPVAANIKLPANSKECVKMQLKYSVEPGLSWGSLPTELQKKWSKLKCDDVVTQTEDLTGGHLNINQQDSSQQIEKHEVVNVRNDHPEKDKTSEHDIFHPISSKSGKLLDVNNAGLPNIKEEYSDWCQNAMRKYEVQPMKSWGKLPMNMIEMWKNRQCDLVFTSKRMGQRQLSSCLDISASASASIGKDKKDKNTNGLFNSILNNMGRTSGNASVASHPNLQSSLPLIAILAGTTTRKVINPSTRNMALFTYLLPSLIRSLDCGFRYEYVLGYDKGDPFYDSEAGMRSVKDWFRNNVEEPMLAKNIKFTLKTVRVINTIRKPGPVFIEMARQAYHSGANYFYRVNDDTEVLNNWPNAFVKALHSLPEPYGVIGPLCKQGNQGILTHDFVHRIHMEVFDMNYYPPQLTDWWMDDWISWVYGQKRTFKARRHPVIHHTGAHGQRYEVDRSHEKLLGELVKSGRTKIRNWMLKKGVSDSVLKEFDSDVFNPGFQLWDIPPES